MVGRHAGHGGDVMAAAKHSDVQLNRTFAALTDPTRRAILTRLEREPGLSVGELARPLAPLKLPGIMKHLDVLEDAGLVARKKTGRTAAVSLVAICDQPRSLMSTSAAACPSACPFLGAPRARAARHVMRLDFAKARRRVDPLRTARTRRHA